MNCLEIYQVTLGLERAPAQRLCQETKYFGFDDNRFESALALISVYLYGENFEQSKDYFREFSEAIWPPQSS